MSNPRKPTSPQVQTCIEMLYPQPSSRLAYLASYYAVALPAILRPHDLRLPEHNETYRARFYVSRTEQAAWLELFGLDGATGKEVPLTYATTAATLVFMRLLRKLGVNFKHVRHVASEMSFLTSEPAVKPDAYYTYAASLEDVFAVGRGRVVLEMVSRVFDETARLCTEHTDFFMVGGFKPEQLASLEGATDRGARFAKVSAHARTLGGEPLRVSVHPRLGIRYGQLSGDMNIVHTTDCAARLMGFPKAFVQGFCTLNLILSRLALRPGIEHLNCTFARPVFVGEDLELFTDGERFELCNRQGKVAAYGELRGIRAAS